MPNSLEHQLGAFLRKKRGDQTYKQFARKLGVGAGTLHRLEQAQQNTTLKMLQNIMRRLKCSLSDIFEM